VDTPIHDGYNISIDNRIETENQEKPVILGIRILLLPAVVVAAIVLYCIKPTNVVLDLYKVRSYWNKYFMHFTHAAGLRLHGAVQ